MTKSASRLIIPILFLSGLIPHLFAQAPTQSQGPFVIQLVLSAQTSDGTSVGGTRTVSLTTNREGKFSFSEVAPAMFPPQCAPAPAVAAQIQEGDWIDGELVPIEGERYQVHLRVRSKTAIGCKQVGNTMSPVMTDPTVIKDAIVSIREAIRVDVKKSDKELLIVDFKLNGQN